ncbi:hypothetical protein [Seonamhaeicola marinus]|nr:hypothetical protein [Seonamhaeicola marinus]
MKNSIKPLALAVAVSLITMACTPENINSTTSTDPGKEDPKPPTNPNG